MKRFRSILKWLFVGTGALVLLVVAAIALYTRSENFNHWVRTEAVAVVNNAIRGSISVERMEGSVWSHLTLYNVALRHEKNELLQIPRVDVSFSLLPLLWSRLQISQIDALKPRASLHQDRDGKWNIAEALAPREPDPEPSSGLITLVQSLRLREAAVELQMAADEGKLYQVRNLDVAGSIGLRPGGVSFQARELGARLIAKGQPELQLKGALDYGQTATAPATVKLKDFWAVSTNSRVKLNGEVALSDVIRIKAQAALEKLAAADIAFFVADWPLKPDLSGSLTLDGPLDDLTGHVNLGGAGAKLAGGFRVAAVESPLRYSAAMTVRGFDLSRWIKTKDFAGIVDGKLEASGRGFTLDGTAADTRFEVRSAKVQGWALGTVALQGRIEKSTAIIDGNLKSALGGASWSGKIALQDSHRPTYDLALSVKNLNVEKALADASTINGTLSLEGTVKGAGFKPADMNTRAEIRILPSSLGPVQLQEGSFDATLRDGKVRIARASLAAAESSLTVSGELGIDAKAAGKLDYRFRSPDLAPWLALLDQKGSGSVDLRGQAQGNLADLQAQGTARLGTFRLAGIAAKNGELAYTIRGSQKQPFPEGIVTLRLADFDAGLFLKRVDGKAKFSQQPTPSIRLDLTAQDGAARQHAAGGTVSFPAGGDVALRLAQLALALPDGSWKLARPATLTQRDGVFFIEGLSMRNGDREISLDGRLGFAGIQNARLTVDRLPLDALAAFVKEPPKMTGLIGARAQISGSAAAPEITAQVKLSDATVAGQAYAGAVADIDYRAKKATLRLAVQQDATHSLRADGTLPLNLSWDQGWRAEAAGGMDLRAQSAGLSMNFLNAFAGKAIENIAGEVALDLVARGSVQQPDVRGSFRLRDGRLKVVPLGVDVAGLTVVGSLDSRNLIIRELSARAKDGEFRGSGSLALKDYSVDAVKVALTAQRWPAIDTMRYRLLVGGKVDVEGTIAAPVIKGNITVTEGSLRPDLAFLEQSKAPFKRDETIVVINKGATNQPAVQAGSRKGNGAEDSALFKNLTLDLTMRAPGNVWVKRADLVSELAGNVRVTKTKERDIELTGRINIVRGWFALQGRRFQLARGDVEFTGGDKINPTLDIVAQYRLPAYQVDATIGGTVEKPSLTLASQPRLEQADILALLLFGRPLNTLNQTEQSSLQQSAINLTSGYVAGRIASSVSTALGLDSLGLDIREIDFNGGRIGFGRYVGNKTYVSVAQEISGEHGREVSVEYEIARDWKIGTSTTSTGSNGIDIIWHKRY